MSDVTLVTWMSPCFTATAGASKVRSRATRSRRGDALRIIGVLLLYYATATLSSTVSAQNVENHTFSSLNRPVPDGNAAGVSDRRVVTSSIAVISKLRVKLHGAGEFNGDLYGYLRCIQGGAQIFASC